MKFKIQKIDGGIRFTAPGLGWLDLMTLEDSRANIWCGTFNGTPPEVFGGMVWHLLKDTMPELGLRVVAYDGEADPFVEQILIQAGFSHDGTRRAWAEDGKDAVWYSILASEVIYEVREPDGNGQIGAIAQPVDAGSGQAAESLG